MEHAVRRRFSRARIARYDPEASRGRRAEAQREAAFAADIVIGTRGALRLFGPASLGLAGFVSPDQMLGIPDFRAAERSFGMLWAAAERVRPDGALIIQSQNPTHYALQAVASGDLSRFYTPELRFPCAEDRKRPVIESVTARLKAAGADFSDVDGVRVKTADGWWLLRASNTQDVLVARCESGNEAGLDRLKAALVAAVKGAGLEPPAL